MKLSIILPVYNVEEYLEECLDSLINQNYQNYEIIAVNDGSKDNSLKILKNYQKKYPHLVKVYDKENGGVSTARNYGIENAKGEYLFFVDSDDCILPNSLKKLGDHLEEDYDVIAFPYTVGTTKENSKLMQVFDSSIEDLNKRLIIGVPGPVNKVCKKSIYTKNKLSFPIGIYHEDLATIPKLGLYANKIKFLDEPLYFYRERPNSATTNKEYRPHVDTVFKGLEQLRECFGNKYQEELEYLHIEHLLRSASIRYLDFQICQKQLNLIVKTMKENYPKWKKNKYYQKENIKKKIMCNLIYHKKYKLISLLRKF